MSNLVSRWRYLLLRQVIRAVTHIGGKRYSRVRAVSSYLSDLIDQGRYAEFNAYVKHGLRKTLGLTGRSRSPHTRRWRSLPIDVRRERLLGNGTIVPKNNVSFPSEQAPILASVVIPCFNYGQYLEEALQSARSQTLESAEVIVVDDGSTDPHTQSVLAELEKRTDVRLIRQTNKGLSAARNAGIALARGEYICCLDADDIILPTYLEQCIAVLECDCSIGFVFSWVKFFGDRDDLWETRDFDPSDAMLGNHTSVCAVFRRDDWQMIGGYSEQMRGGFEDWEFWIRLASAGRRGRAIRAPLFLHRRHGRTMTHDAKDMTAKLKERIRDLNPIFFSDRRLRNRITRLRPSVVNEVPFNRLGGTSSLAPVQKRTLLVAVAWLHQGGAESMLLDILGHLEEDWQIVIVTTGADRHDKTKEFRSVSAQIYHLDGFLAPERWRCFVDYLIRSRNVDAILTSGSVWTLETLPDLRTSFPHLRVLHVLHNHVPSSPFRAALASADAIDRHVGVSSQVVAALKGNQIADETIVRIPNGVDIKEAFNPARVDRNAARTAFSIEPGRLTLLWIGRLSEEKRPLAFLDILTEVNQTLDASAIMIGDGPLARRVARRIDELGLAGRVQRRTHLPRSDISAVYAAADLLVLTSTVEGLPLVVLEALAMGCPVAATTVGDTDRIVIDGRNGFLALADRPLDLARQIVQCGADKTRLAAMRQQARDSMTAGPYRREAMSAAYAALLDELVHRPQNRAR